MSVKGIAFDLEGTVVDVEAAHHGAHLALARELGIGLTLEQAVGLMPHFIGGPDEAVIQELIGLLPTASRSDVDHRELLRRDSELYLQLLAQLPISPRVGFAEVYEAAQRRRLPMSIGSLTRRQNAEHLLHAARLDELFARDRIVLREDVDRVKPEPDVFLKTAARMGIEPQEQLVFEDSPVGVQAACAAGSRVIAMPVIVTPRTIEALKGAGAATICLSWQDVELETLLQQFP